MRNFEVGDTRLDLISNGGAMSTMETAELPNFRDRVWFNEKGVTNILSFQKTRRLGCKMECDNDKDCFVVTSDHGRVVFSPTPEGLHAHKMEDSPEAMQEGVALLNTMEENKAKLSKRQVERAERARALYETMGFSGMRDFEAVVKMNGIRNNPVIFDDIKIMKAICGKYNECALKGKTTRSKPKVVLRDHINVPQELKQQHQEVELCADIMCVQGTPFLVTVSKHIKLITVERLPNRKKMSLLEAFDSAFRVHNGEGYNITHLHCDLEFECLRDEISDEDSTNIKMVCVPRKQHAPEIERCIKTIKERVRALWHALPHASLPKNMIEMLAHRQVKWLHVFPPKGGCSAHHSPRTLLGGAPIDYNTHCKCQFGKCVQAERIGNRTNAMEARTINAIYLDAFNGSQGGFYVLNLGTGKIVAASKLHAMPLPDLAKAKVEALAKRDKVPSSLAF